MLDAKNPSLPEVREIVDEIDQSSVRANDLLRTTRTFLRNRETQTAPVDVHSLVSDVLVLAGSAAKQRSIQISTNLNTGRSRLLGDRTQIQQVLLNLVMNGMDAMQNTPAGARHLDINCRPADDGFVEFQVVDGGCGIPPEKLGGIFEPFFTTKEQGLGLGLAIARSIVETHKGRIWAENNPDGGATFHFTIPIAGRPPKEIVSGAT
jgi:two-component system sensor kinase FixL